MRNTIIALALLSIIVTACGGNGSATQASATSSASTNAAAQSASASTTVGGAVLQTSTIAIADLNETVAGRYGIDRSQEGLLLLVTVRDSAGNGIDPGDLQLSATAATLTDSPTPLELRAIATDGMTDYIGAFNATPPANIQFKLTAIRNGSRADIATTAELYPR